MIRLRVLVITSALIVMAGACVGGGSEAGAARRVRRPTTTVRAVKATALQVDASQLGEVSGCAFSHRDPALVWMHNDSGDRARVIPVNIGTGAVGTSVELAGVEVQDAEDIAITASGDLLLADIGDNNSQRPDVALIRFAEPAKGIKSASAVVTRYTYPDGAHNAESIVVEPNDGAALIITKVDSGQSQVFRADLSPTGSRVMTQVGVITISNEGFFFPNLITGADALGDGSGIVLRTYLYGYVLKRTVGGTFESALAAKPQRFDLPPMAQAEAICSSPDGRQLVTASESRGESTFALAVLPAPK